MCRLVLMTKDTGERASGVSLLIFFMFVLYKYTSYKKHYSSSQLIVSHVFNFKGGSDGWL